jgi:hypothetical protein
MLAYIFWHWPEREVDLAAYERTMLDFHQALKAQAPAGFRASWTFRPSGLPWLPSEARPYEDWYLVDDFAALGPLNDQAVAGRAKAPHDQAARAAAAGAGALYRLTRGAADGVEIAVAEAGYAAWFPKGKQRTYDELFASLEPFTSQSGVSLWRRQMVLGPAPEFCLLAPARLELPDGLGALSEERVRLA